MSENIKNTEEEFGAELITIVDDEGKEIVLEVLDSIEFKGKNYMAFLPTDMDEDDPDYGMIILRVVMEENGDIYYEDVEDQDELLAVYDEFSMILFADEDEE